MPKFSVLSIMTFSTHNENNNFRSLKTSLTGLKLLPCRARYCARVFLYTACVRECVLTSFNYIHIRRVKKNFRKK